MINTVKNIPKKEQRSSLTRPKILAGQMLITSRRQRSSYQDVPTMRHVSRTHRVTLDWLFDRPTSPQIQIKYVDTKNQLADLLTKGNFTRDEWNDLLRLFYIMSFSVFSCSHIKSINKSKIMSKRSMQERKPGEERVVAKSKPMVSLVSKNANRSPMQDSSVCSSSGSFGMQSQSSDRSGTGKPVARCVKVVNENTAPSSQVWHQNENTRSDFGKPVSKLLDRLSETRFPHHNFEIFNVEHLEKIFSSVRQRLSRPERDEVKDVDVLGNLHVSDNEAAVHLGPDYEEHLRTTKNIHFEQVKTLFDISQNVILNHRSEIYGVSTIAWNKTPRMISTSLHDRAIKLSKAKIHVYPDSVLCLVKMHEHPTEKPYEQFNVFLQTFQQHERSPSYLEEANARKKTRKRSWVQGCKIETYAKSDLHDSQLASKSVEFELISQPGESLRKLFKLGFIEYGEACTDGLE